MSGLYFGHFWALGSQCKSCSSSVMMMACLDQFSLNSDLPHCHVCFGSSSLDYFLFLPKICFCTKQLALKLDSPAESSCYLFLFHLAAETLCFNDLLFILAWSCARLLCACWAFVNALWTSGLSLKNLTASVSTWCRWKLLLMWHSFCCFWTAGLHTVRGHADPLPLWGGFSPVCCALRHPPGFHSLIWLSSVFSVG